MNTVINIRTEKRVRDEAKKIFSKMGMTTSAGINMFLEQVIQDEGLPFIPSTNQKKMRERMDKEIEWAIKNTKGYTSIKEMFDDLEKGV